MTGWMMQSIEGQLWELLGDRNLIFFHSVSRKKKRKKEKKDFSELFHIIHYLNSTTNATTPIPWLDWILLFITRESNFSYTPTNWEKPQTFCLFNPFKSRKANNVFKNWVLTMYWNQLSITSTLRHSLWEKGNHERGGLFSKRNIWL